ncbi:hypothetical protein BCR43DRAFT_493314 [Syncephalastrum racemosum]|uniref:Uncharacterized protein n=1 Tax=Syncephalastrum racemosum TaxID=13706 RepID=A0A1X2HAG8_SYNRA|nr:hypothetical protein BCR43DRAFT_493314 [Syncephalastrum racemosum]
MLFPDFESFEYGKTEGSVRQGAETLASFLLPRWKYLIEATSFLFSLSLYPFFFFLFTPLAFFSRFP